MRFMLKSKIHRAKVTDANLNYEGSLSIDTELMAAADLIPYEMVYVYNITNGERFSTYVLPGKKGEICLNGAAARKGAKGDIIIITAYTLVEESQLKMYKPKQVFLDENNAIVRKEG
ncbi:MAG: aspartate 1-decarboxylase [Candidatus Desulfofervidus auxilii]|nr:aspartate 1-decarboxylase [Candidatus Desulfofervidus auxilii]